MNRDPSSFRDNCGFLFRQNNQLFRQINPCYFDEYAHLKASGLLDALWEKELLVRHEETYAGKDKVVIRPQIIPFISYPYEWCFSQYRDAALLTLRIQSLALQHGMTLKDASAYNVQFIGTRAVFIDTLSCERLRGNRPWQAYAQFCRHFLAPLALMSYSDIRLSQLLKNFIDGVPLDLASGLLPWRSFFNSGLLMHLHIHSKMQKRYQSHGADRARAAQVSAASMNNLIEHLSTTVKALTWKLPSTEWRDYYANTNYTRVGFEQKVGIVRNFLKEAAPQTVFDVGANDGTFSQVAREAGAMVVSLDIDPAAVEKNYRAASRSKETLILPLIFDLTNPSPEIGWSNEERQSLFGRGPADCVLALALVHHLAISHNIPLGKIAEAFSRLGTWLIIEFIPKNDSKVAILLSSREDIFDRYTEAEFEAEFSHCFTIIRRAPVADSARTLYLMKRIDEALSSRHAD